jgi:hypothetical protein
MKYFYEQLSHIWEVLLTEAGVQEMQFQIGQLVFNIHLFELKTRGVKHYVQFVGELVHEVELKQFLEQCKHLPLFKIP